MSDRVKQVLSALNQSTMPPALYAMSMASDAQELIAMGNVEDAREVLNDLKIVIDHKLSVKDEQGRHI